MTVLDERQAADEFWRELAGERPARSRRRPGPSGESLLVLPRGPLVSGAAEPFFGDPHGQGWQVVGWPGALVIDLRGDDLVVRPRDDGSYDAVRAADASPASVFRGPSRRLRRDALVLRRQPAGDRRPATRPDEQQPAQVCGFFGPHNITRTIQEVCDAVVLRANAEWTAWHSGATPRFESNPVMFGRLFGYYLAAVGTLRPDTLLHLQAVALAPINYASLLTAASAAAAGTAATALATTLIAGAPAPAIPGLATTVRAALLHAREAFLDSTDSFASWSAVFVVTCVRTAGILQGLETIVGATSRHVGKDVLLLADVAHAAYTRTARQRLVAGTAGTYHAFTPDARSPRAGDIIVLDRQATTEKGVVTLNALDKLFTHGDIVVDVNRDQRFAVTIGGNLSDGTDPPPARQDSARKRRYPLDANGRLVRDRQQLITQEDAAGDLPALPATSTESLHKRSTARIFALLSPVHACRPRT